MTSIEGPPKLDLIQVFSDYPTKVPSSARSLIDRLRQIYGESLQPCLTEVFYTALEQRDAYVTQFVFLSLLNEQEFVINMVHDQMPEEKLPRLRLFLDYLHMKYRQMLSVHPTTDNIEELLRTFCEACTSAWTLNLQQQMHDELQEFDA